MLGLPSLAFTGLLLLLASRYVCHSTALGFNSHLTIVQIFIWGIFMIYTAVFSYLADWCVQSDFRYNIVLANLELTVMDLSLLLLLLAKVWPVRWIEFYLIEIDWFTLDVQVTSRPCRSHSSRNKCTADWVSRGPIPCLPSLPFC